MPAGNQTGSSGQGYGGNKGSGQGGQGFYRGGQRPGSGPGGECVCPACGERLAHQRGIPCTQTSCPRCGQPMTRR